MIEEPPPPQVAPAGLLARAEEIARGRLRLRPHPEWTIPDTMTWDEDPFGQRNFQAQLHMLRWLEPVRDVAERTQQPEWQELWWRHVSSWIDASRGHRGSPAWMDMVDGIRVTQLVHGWPLVPEDERDRFRDVVREHVDWLKSPSSWGHSNHCVHQMIGLMEASRFLEDPSGLDIAVSQLRHLLEANYDRQGMNAEGAPTYHFYNYRLWSGVLDSLRAIDSAPRDLVEEVQETLSRAEASLIHSTRPDGTWEQLGDTPRGRATQPRTDEGLYVSTQGGSGTPPAEVFKLYDTGYAYGRSGWGEFARDFEDETFYSVLFGLSPKVHGHFDAGSVTYFSRGRSWIADPGKYAYVNDDFRRHLFSRAAHNVVSLPHRTAAPDVPVTLEASNHTPAADFMHLLDRSYEGVELHRRISFHRGGEFLVVVDDVLANEETTAVQNWQLHSDVEADEPSAGDVVIAGGDDHVQLSWLGSLPDLSLARGQEDPLRGWISEEWMEKKSATSLQATMSGSRLRFVTVIGVQRKGAFEIVDSSVSDDAVHVAVRLGPVVHDLTMTDDSVSTLPPATPSANGHDRAASVPAELADSLSVLESAEIVSETRAIIPLAGPALVEQVLMPRLADLRVRSEGPDQLAALMVDLQGLIPDSGPIALDLLFPNRRPCQTTPGRSPEIALGRHRAPMLCHAEALDSISSGESSPVIGTHVAADLVTPWAFVPRERSEALIVRLHGALDRQTIQQPVLLGAGQAQTTLFHSLLVQDPSLDLGHDLRLTWYLGSALTDGHEAVADLVRSVASRLGDPLIIFEGSSGGGFAALQLAALVDGSVAVAANPQTDLRRYYSTFHRLAMDRCLGGEPTGPELTRISVAERWKTTTTPIVAHLIANQGDRHHVENHITPLHAEAAGLGHVDLTVHEEDWGPGHLTTPADSYALVHDLILGGAGITR